MEAAVAHRSPYAGSWYPGEPSELRELLARLFEESARRTGPFLFGGAVGFVVPHAGLIYSGTVAAAAYRHIQAPQPQRIVLLGFAHRGAPAGIWAPDVEAFRTPLGEMAVDGDAVGELTASGAIGCLPETSLCDHSVEIQLPLLQKAAPGARLVPLYVSRLTPSQREAGARALAGVLGPDAVLVASSDFTHYGRPFHFEPFPADHHLPERLRELDLSVIDAAGSLREEMFFEALRSSGATVCGYEPIGLLLATLRQMETPEDEIFQEVLDYDTSGEITGDYQHSVSYAALGYVPFRAMLLDREGQELLLDSARRTLRHYLETGERKPVGPERRSMALEQRAAAFVTLHKGETLRGCVGRRTANEPLATLIPELTLAAATEDSRFQPVSPDETGIDLEISVLTPMKRLADRPDFRIQVHGALVESGFHHGLLLPQVAWDRSWTAKDFFNALARKAGADPTLYDDPFTRLYIFRAQVLR